MKVETLPWLTPNFVRIKRDPRPRQEGIDFNAAEGFSLEQVDAETLSDMCDEFRREIFNKAKKEDPKAKVEFRKLI